MTFVKPKKGECHSRKRPESLTVAMATGATGAKFHLQCINISRDILDFVICLHTVATYDVITFF